MGLGSWPGTGSLAWTSCWTMTAAMSSRVTSFCRGSSGVCRRASIWKPSLFRPLEQLLDGPTTAIKAGPVEGVFGRGQLAGGDQPPVQRRRVRRSVDLAHIHQRHAHRPGQARAGGSVARPGQIHLDPPHGHLRGPGLAAASSRQLQRLASGFQQGVEPGEQKSAIVQRAVLRGPNQHLHARQRLRQGLVDVALAIGDHRHPPRRRSTPPHQPPPASDGSPSPRRARSCAARGAPPCGSDAAPRPVSATPRPRRPPRSSHAGSAPAAGRVSADARGVLDRQNMPPGTGHRRAKRRRGHHLPDINRRVLQEPSQPHLSGAVAAKRADRRLAPRPRHRPVQRPAPPLSRRRSPNRPRPIVIALSPRQSRQGIRAQVPTQSRCVDLLAQREKDL